MNERLSKSGRDVSMRLRLDEFTGEDRCWPCTVLNGCILLLLGISVGGFVSLPVGVCIILVGTSIIWLRGYLIPFTPRLVPRLLAVLPTDRFERPFLEHVDRTTTPSNSGASEPSVDITETLVNAAILTVDGETLSIDPRFFEAWWGQMREIGRVPDGTLTTMLRDEIPWVTDVSVVRDDGRWFVLSDGSETIENEVWLPTTVATADVAAVRTLAAQTEIPAELRTLAAPPLRQFLDRCPRCESTLTQQSRTCCGSPQRVAEGIDLDLVCPECDETVAVVSTDLEITDKDKD